MREVMMGTETNGSHIWRVHRRWDNYCQWMFHVITKPDLKKLKPSADTSTNANPDDESANDTDTLSGVSGNLSSPKRPSLPLPLHRICKGLPSLAYYCPQQSSTSAITHSSSLPKIRPVP
ncbi:hypothetical protein VKT23_008090 [Stygiomarasmius scandens]|uniref:Uncharacterized protein n=1 Tax=Marasmiellus scandens TaxID=2682957 RepID=A0ABR1JLI8_9AGAR